ncbi:MAG: hypothetical protein HY587_00390 [Candidatus Omnitrophica bacterium]|nr:hypothetical protein [Candidatus Omnitrophota bacterium]
MTTAFVLSFIPSFSVRAAAVPAEDLVSPESITAQIVSDAEAAAPYIVTGESLVTLVRKMVNFDVQGSTVVFNRNTGQLFVRNTPQNHEEIGRMLNRVRRAFKQQIEIEAQIITISSTDFEGLGIDEILLDASAETAGKLGRVGTDITFGDDTFTHFVDFANIADSASATGQLSFGVLSDGFDFRFFFDLISSKAEVNTLSAPRIIVTNNQRAHLKIEKAQYYVRELESEATTGSDPVVTLKPKIGIAESGTILDVTPTINADGTITLELHPTFVRADLTTTKTINVAPTSTLETSEQPFVTLPVFTNQQADTTLTVVNGGTAIIGGYVAETEIVKDRSIPILNRIPLLSRLSKQETRSQARTYLMMFVRASIRSSENSYLK